MREQSNADIVSLPPDYKQGSFLRSVIERSDSLGRMDTELTKYYKNFNEKEKLSLHHLLQEYFDMILDGNYSADKFLAFCRNRMKKNVCQEAASATVMQANCALWHELRYGRITASKAYDAMHCHKMDGSLVEMVLGASKLKDTVALKRGRMLEKEVMSSLQQTLNMKIEPCGIMLSSEYPVIGASPDGICHDYIVEIKCPASEKTLRNYITSNKTITAKYFAQMQMQMHLYEKEKGIFCVANSDYELTKKINVLTVQYDKMFCEQMLQKCTEFWSKAIFTRLSSNYL